MKNLFDAVVVTSFLGISSFDTNDNSYAGYIGHTGHLSANQAVHECDFLLVLGSRLDVRQTGTLVESFVPKGIVVSVNNDLTELDNSRVEINWKINLDLKGFCNLVKQNENLKISFSDKNWKKKIYDLKKSQIEDIPSNKSSYIQPKEVMKKLSQIISSQKTVVVTGVGCHQHWAARHLPFKPKNNLFLSSGGHGTMGYDLPSAIGASMTLNNFRVFCIVGDGSLLMNIQELASLSERNLDVKIILMNNNRLGIVSQFQKITWGKDPSTGYFNTPDFVSIANGFSIKAKKITNPSEINTGIDWINSFTGPGLLEIVIDKDSDVVPMLMSEQPMNSMYKE